MGEEPSGSSQGREGGAAGVSALLREAGKELMPVLISVGSLLGFVAFAGGVILWTRFYAVGVPPEQAVDAVPDGELIATGSVLLLLFGFFGTLALVSAFLVDRSVRSTPGMARLLLALFAIEGGVAVVLAGDHGLWPTVADLLLFALPVVGAAWVTVLGGFSTLEDDLRERPREQLEPIPNRGFLRPDPGPGSGRKAPWALAPLAIVAASTGAAMLMLAHDASDTVLLAVLGGFALLMAVAMAGLLWRDQVADRSARAAEKEAEREAEAERKAEDERARRAEVPCWRACLRRMRGALPGARCRARREPAPERDPREEERCGPAAGAGIKSRMDRPRPRRLELNVGGGLVVLALLGVAVVLAAWRLEKAWLLVALLAAALIAAAVWRVALLANERRVWFGIAVFLSVPLFGTAMTMVRNINEPKVQPMAIIRSDDGPTDAIQGLYVTETDERVYFANVATEGCGDDFKRNGSRLLWVPQDDVVAMSVGPAQDVESAGRSAQEMSNALTPGIETSTGEKVTLRTGGEEEDAGDAAETEKGKSAKAGGRLETAGPAVRPEFGRGLTLDPLVAVPGQRVELTRPLAPGQEGFGREQGSEKTLRLNGVELDVEEWTKDTITFRVPESATSGVVTIECEALAGQPYLTVSRKPEARISVKMRPNSNQVGFDSRRSTDEGEIVERDWAVSGLAHGNGEEITRALPPRTGFYRVRLTVTDDEGETDTAVVRLLRLRAPQFDFGSDSPRGRRMLGDLLKAISRMAKENVRQAVRRTKAGGRDWREFLEAPVAIRIDGHADDGGTRRRNERLSWRRATGLWEELDGKGSGRAWAKAEPAPKLTIRGFGKSCPLDSSGGHLRVNRRVEVFVLGPGARLIHPPKCHAAQVKRAVWGDPPP